MKSFAFRVRLRGRLSDADADRLYEGLGEEVAVEEGPKGSFVGFERQADSFLEAVLDAVNEVAVLGFEPLAVEDELVSMADIAERCGRTASVGSVEAGAAKLVDVVAGGAHPSGMRPNFPRRTYGCTLSVVTFISFASTLGLRHVCHQG